MFRHVFADALESYFGSDSMKRAYRTYIICLGIVILLSWPVDRLSYIVHFSTRPSTFAFALFASFAFSLYFSLHFPNTTTPRVWLRFGGATTAGIVIGVVLFSILHTLILTALAMPLALAAIAVSGLDPGTLIRAYAIIAIFCFAIRMGAQALRVLVTDRGCLRPLIMIGVLLFFGLISAKPFPYLNPIIALINIHEVGSVSHTTSGELIKPTLGGTSIRAFAVASILTTLLYVGSIALLSAGIRGTSEGTNRT